MHTHTHTHIHIHTLTYTHTHKQTHTHSHTHTNTHLSLFLFLFLFLFLSLSLSLTHTRTLSHGNSHDPLVLKRELVLVVPCIGVDQNSIEYAHRFLSMAFSQLMSANHTHTHTPTLACHPVHCDICPSMAT